MAASPSQPHIDPDFLPQKRPRSCTWPLPKPDPEGGKREPPDGDIIPEEADDGEDYVPSTPTNGPHAPSRVTRAPPGQEFVGSPPFPQSQSFGPSNDGLRVQQARKSSRRNAWGNLSYADLITKAIESSPEKRLTLSQIYDWMVRCVPYFRDKGDSNSSAGWKNSIRHNLSLHSRFLRVQNEGTGKSSWWMINPEGGVGGKAPRRRAVSMDNCSKCTRSRGRAAKKKAASMAQAGQDGSVGSPLDVASPGSDELDAWTDFRSRTSSNASTASGRLTPIPANSELDEVANGDDDEDILLYSSPCSVSPLGSDFAGAVNLNDCLSVSLMDDLLDNMDFALGGRDSPTYESLSLAGIRATPMQTIQENRQAVFRGHSLMDPPDSDVHHRRHHLDVMMTQLDPLMSQAGAMAQNLRRSLLLHTDPMLSNHSSILQPHNPLMKSWRASLPANGDLESSNQANNLMSVRQNFPPTSNTSMQTDSQDLDLEMLSSSLESETDAAIQNDLLDAEGLDCSVDSLVLPANGGCSS